MYDIVSLEILPILSRLDNLNDEELYMEAQADASMASESSSVRISDFTLTSFAEEISY
jgi:hypothetical protein